MLHTWSLGVEEQFYILFPFFLLFCLKFGRSQTFRVFFGVAILSLVLAEWGSQNYATANFYLLPTRAWELLAGSLVALHLHNRQAHNNSWLAGLGITAIAASYIVFDQHTPSPSFISALPVGGTVLIILFANQNLVSRVLGSPVFVKIGLISYSAYLWHQPLLAFARIRAEQHPSAMLLFVLASASFPLAFLTWKYVETPFRSRKKVSRQTILAFSSIALVLPVFLGTLITSQNAFASKEETRSQTSPQIIQQKDVSPLSRDIIVLGDSHGDHLVSGLSAITKGEVQNLTSSGCIPFRDVDRYDSRFRPGECSKFMNFHLDSLLAKDPDALIVLSTMGPVYIEGTTFRGHDKARVTGLGVELLSQPEITDRSAVFELGLRQTLSELSTLERAEVIFAIDIPELGIKRGCDSDPKQISLGTFTLQDFVSEPDTGGCWIPRAEFDERVESNHRLIEEVTSNFPKISVFDPTELFCDTDRCIGYDDVYGFLYRDVDHLSTSGSLYFAKALAEKLTHDLRSR